MPDSKGSQDTGSKRPNPIQMQKFLKGANYPAGKDDLVRTAQANHAPDDVVKTLQGMGGDKYANPAEVMKAVSHK